nr:MAG TPA: hypothetical protein [Caudoviricetes sp.]
MYVIVHVLIHGQARFFVVRMIVCCLILYIFCIIHVLKGFLYLNFR